MGPLSRVSVLFALVALALTVTGCVSPADATRDGGTACASTADCNRGGVACGQVSLCVVGYCTVGTEVRACPDGAYPDTGAVTGNCLTYRDCNPGLACGLLAPCVDNACSTTAPRLEIPCELDAGGAGSARDAASSSPDR